MPGARISLTTDELAVQLTGASRDAVSVLAEKMREYYDLLVEEGVESAERLAGFSDGVEYVEDCLSRLTRLEETLKDLFAAAGL